MRKLLKKYAFVPERLITDDLRSYSAAVHVLGIKQCHQRGRWRNNRAENSYLPTRGRPIVSAPGFRCDQVDIDADLQCHPLAAAPGALADAEIAAHEGQMALGRGLVAADREGEGQHDVLGRAANRQLARRLIGIAA